MLAHIINVDHEILRWESVVTQCKNAGLLVHRIPGILAKSMSREQKLTVTTKYCANFCPHAYLGISLSHLRAWKSALDSEFALICEDDVEFVDGFQEKLKECMGELPKDWDILYAGCLFCEGNLNGFAKLGMNVFTQKNPRARKISKLIHVPEYAFGTHAYVVSSKGLRKLISYFSIIDDIVDVKLHRLAVNGHLNVYASTSMLARQSVNASASSISSSLPRVLKFFDNIEIAPDVSLRYGLSYPHMRVGNQNITSWSFIFFVVGFVFGFAINAIITLVFLPVFFSLDVGDEQLLGALTFFVTGFFFGRAFTSLRKSFRVSKK